VLIRYKFVTGVRGLATRGSAGPTRGAVHLGGTPLEKLGQIVAASPSWSSLQDSNSISSFSPAKGCIGYASPDFSRQLREAPSYPRHQATRDSSDAMSASAASGGIMMPAAGAPKETRRRSRRGCIPCRKRHRKCRLQPLKKKEGLLANQSSGDEQKPSCGSCQERRVDCAYKPLTWISDVHSKSTETKDSTSAGPRSNSSRLPSPTPAHVSSPSPTAPMGAEPQEMAASAAARISIEGDPALAERRSFVRVGLPPAAPRDMSVSSRAEGTVRLTNSGPVEPCRVAATLRSFIYDIAPLIDSSAPRSSFAVEVLEMARTSDAISEAITLVVKARLAHTRHSNEPRVSLAETRRAPADLFARDEFAARVGHALLTLESFFGTRPSDWSGIRVQYSRDESPDTSLQSVKEPLQSLLRYQIKIGTMNHDEARYDYADKTYPTRTGTIIAHQHAIVRNFAVLGPPSPHVNAQLWTTERVQCQPLPTSPMHRPDQS
jgi:hypothetical protein